MNAALLKDPVSGLGAKITRRAARLAARDVVMPTLSRGLVSLCFDDCPRSAMEAALPELEERGWRATIFAAMGLCGTTNHLGLHMSEADMVETHRRGHEIGDHTFSHLSAMTHDPDAMMADIARNRARFASLGLPEATSFAYPYGHVTPAHKRALGPDFALCRGVHAPKGCRVDLGLAASGRLYSSDMTRTLDLIDQAATNRRWLILFGHDVREAPSAYGCTPDEWVQIVQAIETHDLDVLPVRDALERIR